MDAMDMTLRDQTLRDRTLAHALARVALGTNISIHGLARMPHIAPFAAQMRVEFSQTFLPGALVEATGYAIVVAEAGIGLLILAGLRLRIALILGLVLMIVLQFGTCVRQDWNVAGLQLPYVGLYALLLATCRYDRYSVDGLLRGNREPAYL